MKASCVCALFWAPLLQAQSGATVEGSVRNSATHAGIGGAEVHLWTKDSAHFEATTDDAGAFHIAGMKDGDYNMRFEKPGFAPPGAHDLTWRSFRVSSAKEVNRLDVEMAPWAMLSGRVLDSEGQPAAQVEVQINPGKNVTTDDTGRFAFNDLEPGVYFVLATPAKAVSAPRSSDGERIETLPTYFPSVVDRAQAESIQVRAGVNLSGYDIRLRTAPVYRVRGVVLDEAGKPAPMARVTLQPRENAGGGVGTTMAPGGVRQYHIAPSGGGMASETAAGAGGAFEFASVRAGDWRITAEFSLGWNSARRRDNMLMGSSFVLVDRRDIDHLQVRLEAPISLDVAADWGDAPPGNTRPRVGLMLSSLDGQLAAMLLSAPDGTLRNEMDLFPGRYRIDTGWSLGGYYPASARLGGREVLGEVIDLQPRSPPLRVVFKAASSHVRGTVDKGEGATVLLWRQEADGSIAATSAPAGPNGAFAMDSIPPGDYYAQAFDRVDPLRLADASLYRGLTATAARIQVEEGASASLQLAVTRWPD